MWIGDGPILTEDHPIGYQIQLPMGFRAFINDFNGCAGFESWRLRIEQPDGQSSPWFGEHQSLGAALAMVRAYLRILGN
jgi:hypothetical protein